MDFEIVRARLIEKFGDDELGILPFFLGITAKQEQRQPTEEEMYILAMCGWLHRQVEAQMHHLSSLCEEPIPDPADMDEDEQNRLRDDIAFERRDEKVAARVNLVCLHEPIPSELEGDELTQWLDERKRTFVPILDLTVRQAFNYYDYWLQEEKTDESMKWFFGEWHGSRQVAELTGDDVPQTIGEYLEYLEKRAKEDEESERSEGEEK